MQVVQLVELLGTDCVCHRVVPLDVGERRGVDPPLVDTEVDRHERRGLALVDPGDGPAVQALDGSTLHLVQGAVRVGVPLQEERVQSLPPGLLLGVQSGLGLVVDDLDESGVVEVRALLGAVQVVQLRDEVEELLDHLGYEGLLNFEMLGVDDCLSSRHDLLSSLALLTLAPEHLAEAGVSEGVFARAVGVLVSTHECLLRHVRGYQAAILGACITGSVP